MSNGETVSLDLGAASYEIHIGAGLLSNAELFLPHVAGGQVFVISNDTVARHYLAPLVAQFENKKVDVHLMPDGEQHKTLATLEAIVGSLLESGHNRTTTIVALGGGVVGDTAGFAAASYQRGVPFIQIPTTLLSQVDSSVGGKTAVNHPLGKNMIGAFYQPKTVVIDINTLKTLPDREFSAGLAEVIKHGILASADYFELVEREIENLQALKDNSLIEVVRGSCEIKAAVVAEDEKESGRRALLNFGHTFAHAIETGMGYGEWLHGEAVGAGMVMAADLSMRLGRCSAADAARIKRLIEKAGLPVNPPKEISSDAFLAMMGKDKKVTDAGIRFVLLAGGIGQTALVDDVPMDRLQQTLSAGDRLCEQ